jgi:hypothetical protein
LDGLDRLAAEIGEERRGSKRMWFHSPELPPVQRTKVGCHLAYTGGAVNVAARRL